MPSISINVAISLSLALSVSNLIIGYIFASTGETNHAIKADIPVYSKDISSNIKPFLYPIIIKTM